MNTKTITKMNPNNLAEVNDFLGRCARVLANVCDRAHDEDGNGFNGGDADFGHSMAQRNPASYSPKMTAALVRMLRKYRKQLAGFGLDYDCVPEGLEKWESVAAIKEAQAPVQQAQPKAAQTSNAIAGRTIEEMPGGYYKLSFPYNPQIVADVKGLTCFRKFEREPSGACYWLVRITGGGEEMGQAAAAFAKIAYNHRFGVPAGFHEKMIGEVGKAIEAVNAQAENHALSSATDAQLSVQGIGGELMPFQRGGVAYVQRNRCAIIGDEMGLGKTPQSLVAAQALGAFPCIIICRANLKTNWLREAKKWLPGRTVSGNVYDRAQVTIATHDEAIKHNKGICEIQPRGLIADESQDFKNHKAQRTKAVQSIADSMPEDGMKLLLSGTPVENRPAEFISQLRIIEALDGLGGWKGFTERYCAAKQTRFGLDIKGASNLEELNRKLREKCYIRRLKKDVLTDLPDKVRSIVDVELSNRAEYQATAAEVRARLMNLVAKSKENTQAEMTQVSEMDLPALIARIEELAPNFSKGKMLDLQKASGEELEEAKREARGVILSIMKEKERGTANAGAFMELGKLMERAGLGKVEFLKEWIADFIEGGGKKLIVFAKHITVQRAIFESLPGAIWTRDSKWKSVQDAVDAFQTSDAPVIVCSLKGDNAGLNITAASYVLFAERDWKPSTHLQAEDRAHRIGQKSCVNVYYFDALNSVDETLREVNGIKADITTKVLDGGEVNETEIMKAVVARIMGAK